MRKLTVLSEIAASQTKLDIWVAEGKLNSARVEAFKAKAANATAELQIMQSNTTLASECMVVDAERKSINQCKQMEKLTKLAVLAVLAGNDTALAAFEQKKGLNQTGIEKLKAEVAEASTNCRRCKPTPLSQISVPNVSNRGAVLTTSHNTTHLLQVIVLTSSLVSDSDNTTQAGLVQQSTGGTSGLTMPYVLLPALAAVFALFL